MSENLESSVQENTSSSVVESQVTSTESESTEHSAPETNIHAVETPSRPAGYEPIDENTASPEQVRDRLNYLYRQVKGDQREKGEMRRVLSEQSRIINDLTSGVNSVVTHLQDRSLSDNETQLNNLMQQAFERGDNKAYIDTQNQLLELKVQKRLAAEKRTQAPTASQQQPATQQNAGQVAQNAMEGGELSQAEYRATDAWQSEKDHAGKLLRPWAYNTDPNYKGALEEARAVFNNPRFEHLPYEQKLAEIDRRMGMAKRTTSQTVMGGSLTNGRKLGKVTLTPKQQEIAIRTKYAGPKAKSDADHLDAYRKQIERVNQQKGVRT